MPTSLCHECSSLPGAAHAPRCYRGRVEAAEARKPFRGRRDDRCSHCAYPHLSRGHTTAQHAAAIADAERMESGRAAASGLDALAEVQS